MISLCTSSEDLARGVANKIYWEVTLDAGPTTHLVNGDVVGVRLPRFNPRTPLTPLAAKLLVVGVGWLR